MIFFYKVVGTRHPKGGGWAEPKNGEAYFWARSWRAVWVCEHGKSQLFYKQIVRLLRIVKFRKTFNLIFFKVALLLVLRAHCT